MKKPAAWWNSCSIHETSWLKIIYILTITNRLICCCCFGTWLFQFKSKHVVDWRKCCHANFCRIKENIRTSARFIKVWIFWPQQPILFVWNIRKRNRFLLKWQVLNNVNRKAKFLFCFENDITFLQQAISISA